MTNEVSCVQRTGLHARAVLHCNINVAWRSKTVGIDADCFVHHRNQDTVYNKARTFMYSDRSFIKLGHQVKCKVEGFI